MTLKQRFLDAIASGDLGTTDHRGVIVTLQEFKTYFKDVKTRYITSFLPAAVIETGQRSMTHTQFLFRINKGVYLLHPDALAAHRLTQTSHDLPRQPTSINEIIWAYAM